MAAYRQTVLTAFGQIADLLQAIAHDNQAYAEQSAALDAQTRRLSAVRDSYAAGGASALQLVDAERAWRRERLAVAHLGTSRYADAAMLLVATATVPPGVAEGK
jgi:outer membrane protein TolC